MNKSHSLLLLFLIAFSIQFCTTPNDRNIFPEDAKLEELSRQFTFTEGPSADKEGNVFFSDQPNNKIYQYSISGELTVFLDEAGRSNGLYFDKNDMLWACADAYNQLWKIDKAKNIEVILNADSSEVFNGPNDVWVHENGDVYFTDPYYKRPYWIGERDTLQHQGLYLLLEGKGEPILLDSTMVRPNGIVGNSKKNLLFVADRGDNRTYQFKLTDKGGFTERVKFVEQDSDGMTLDSHGNLYLTGKGVDIFNAEGEKVKHLDIPENWTANICFGGRKNNELFITASKGLYRITTNVRGVK